ncbi:MAG: hypothetical protein J6N52_01255 [Clostridia bacterium]|nr:hypothetical protein [Clostridia bacterium]
MKTILNKILFVFIILVLSTASASASERVELSDCGIQSIVLPDGAKTATRDLKQDNPLISMLQTDRETLYNNMVAGNTYLISFMVDETQAVQYVVMSVSNSGIEGGSLNAVSGEQLNAAAEQIGNAAASDGASKISSCVPVTLANGNFAQISGSLSDESNGRSLYFQTYGTVQSGKLIFIRALNYTGKEFTAQQLDTLKQVAQSAVFEPYSPKPSEAVSNKAVSDAKPSAPSSSAPAEDAKTEPESEESVSAASTEVPDSSAETAKPETEEQNQSDGSHAEDNKKVWPVIAAVLLIVIAAAAVFYFRKRKR